MKTPLRQHYVVDWSIAVKGAIEKLVQDNFPQDAHRWPLLRAFNAEGHVWRGTHLVVVLKDKLSGIPAIGQQDDLDDPSAPADAPSDDNLDRWFSYLQTKFAVGPQDAVAIIPIVDSDEKVGEQWDRWTAADKALWNRQLQTNLNTHYYRLKGFDLSADFFIPPGYQFLADDCERFFQEHPHYDKNVFIMTRFQRGDRLLESLDAELRRVLKEHGLDPVRADDKMYLRDRNLWNNVCLYMICCKQGIAILENRIEDEFNPNVALEYGFMRGQNRPALLLKDVAFRRLRADIMGTLWEEFDLTNIEGTIRAPVEKWLKELGQLR